ncbi:MAG: MATE family efflux transporter [Anaerovoracaceae bacterium]
MMKDKEMETNYIQQDITKQFAKYVVPSMLTMILTGFYGIVDGFFVGQVMGDEGLAAINIAWPMLSLLSSLGVGIGTGGAIIMSIHQGAGRPEEAERAEKTAIILLVLFSAAVTALYFGFAPAVLKVLGAEGIIYEYGMDYIKVVMWGGTLQIVGSGLTPILKNLGKPVYAMIVMITGMVVNVLFDWITLYKWQWGLSGAAFATCLGQGVVALLAVAEILRMGKGKKKTKTDMGMAGDILKIGASPFGLTFAPGIVIIFTNLQSLRYGGTDGVAVYTVMSYAAYLIYSLMQGLADGIQPIISFCQGAGDGAGMKRVLKKSLLLAGIMSVLLVAVTVSVRYEFAVLYGVSERVAREAVPAMLALAAAVPFIAVARLMSAYFYAIDDGKSASLMVYADPLIFTPVFLAGLPPVFNLEGIWLAYPATQFSLSVLAVILVIYRKKLENKTPQSAAS